MIVVDKAGGWTSHDVVNKMRRIAGTRRVGHLGTLDPMATGVLPLIVNRATRLAQFFVKNDKVYEGTIRFGQATNTYDAEGEPVGEPRPFLATPETVEPLLAAFRGTIQQTPPPVSAKKINGQPAYKLARKNLPVELKAVEVTVHELTLLGCEGADARVRVHCSSGTYLRAIAHDAGQSAGVGAHLASLRRLRAGDFSIEQARTLEELHELSAAGRLGEALLPCAALLPDFPPCPVDRLTESQIRQGRDFRTSPFRTPPGTHYVKAISEDGALVAIGEAVLPNLYHPMLVL
ncbi:MAG: tRNA pseudouridine(55) synthase TruB [Bryobacterales bacterium]|nr:tRNA pseudouridine(55) synthase TruB [Bryobacterales bacterium]